MPFSRIDVDTDLLRSIHEKGVDIEAFGISSISFFEMQAKALRLGVPVQHTIEAVNAIGGAFRVEPFYNPKVVEVGAELSRRIKDYIDCLILATAIVLGEGLVTEDSKIHEIKEEIKRRYGIDVLNSKEFLNRLEV